MKLDVIYEAYHDGAIEVVEEEAESLVLSEDLEEDSFKFTISIPAHVSKATYYLDNGSEPGDEDYEKRKTFTVRNTAFFEASGNAAKLD